MATISPKRFKQGNITTGRTVTRTYYQKKTGTYVTKTYTYSKTPTRQSQNIFKKNGEFKKKALARIEELKKSIYDSYIESGDFNSERSKAKLKADIDIAVETYQSKKANDMNNIGFGEVNGSLSGLESSIRYQLDRSNFTKDDIFLNNLGMSREDFINEYNDHHGTNYTLDDFDSLFSAYGKSNNYEFTFSYEGDSGIKWLS